MAKRKPKAKKPQEHLYFFVDFENGQIEEFQTIDALKASMQDNDSLRESIENGYGDDQFAVIKGKKLRFDTAFTSLEVTIDDK